MFVFKLSIPITYVRSRVPIYNLFSKPSTRTYISVGFNSISKTFLSSGFFCFSFQLLRKTIAAIAPRCVLSACSSFIVLTPSPCGRSRRTSKARCRVRLRCPTSKRDRYNSRSHRVPPCRPRCSRPRPFQTPYGRILNTLSFKRLRLNLILMATEEYA